MIQENYAMDAVQRDLNVVLTPDQIDQGRPLHLHYARSGGAKRRHPGVGIDANEN